MRKQDPSFTLAQFEIGYVDVRWGMVLVKEDTGSHFVSQRDPI